MVDRFLSVLFFVIFCVLPCYANTPTGQFLEKHPLHTIEATIKTQGENGFDTTKFFPFFLSVIEQENERCFGYHATTSAHMVFQEMVRCTLEELYGYTFPDDFYFLRAPDPQMPSYHSAHEFLKQFSRKKLSCSDKCRFIELFFLKPLSRYSGAVFSLELVGEDAVDLVYQALLHFAPVAPVVEKSQDEVQLLLKEFAAKRAIATPGVIHDAVDRWLKDPTGAYEEDLDSTSHEFMLSILYPYDDTNDTQQALLSSLNISLFGNYFVSTESTVHVFAKASSVALRKSHIQAKAREFFKRVGLDASLADDIYTYSKERLKLKGGVLLQFFDRGYSDGLLANTNKATFVCTNFGVPDSTLSPSALVSDFSLYQCDEGFVPSLGHIVIHPQLRLLAIPSAVLNPFSWLAIKQYDLMSHKAKVRLKMYIRQKVQRAKKDAVKRANYRDYLEQIWGLSK